uniref:Uncharacterized protein n=1 Tax=Oryza brachyantha TaxID=4533 RepID=J3N4Q1_ORYBR
MELTWMSYQFEPHRLSFPILQCNCDYGCCSSTAAGLVKRHIKNSSSIGWVHHFNLGRSFRMAMTPNAQTNRIYVEMGSLESHSVQAAAMAAIGQKNGTTVSNFKERKNEQNDACIFVFFLQLISRALLTLLGVTSGL